MRKKDLKVVQKFKFLVSQKVRVHEVRVFGRRAREDAFEEWVYDDSIEEAKVFLKDLKP